jgi:cell filamentation protein
MEHDEHYYVSGYSVEDDPYCQSNGVLINNFDIQDSKRLNEIEAEFSSIALQELLLNSSPDTFTTDYLKFVHNEIFKEIYPWAGQFRKVDIGKADIWFKKHQDIEAELKSLFEGLASANTFMGLDLDTFSKNAAEFLAKLNHIHPFREGNGRTQRLVLSQIAIRNNMAINWEGISSSAMNKACNDGIAGNFVSMQKLLKIYIEARNPQKPKI